MDKLLPVGKKNPVCLHSQRPIVSGGREGGTSQCGAHGGWKLPQENVGE